MILHCGSAEDVSGGTAILDDQVLEFFSPTDPSSAILATATESFMDAAFA